MKEKVSDYTIEKYILNEMTDEQKSIMEKHKNDEDVKKRILLIKASNAEILKKYPNGHIEIAKKLNKENDTKGKVSKIFLPAAIAALFLIFLIPAILTQKKNIVPKGAVRIKGDEINRESYFSVYKKTGNKSKRLESGMILSKGDVIQLSYTSGGKKYGVLFSIDGRGILTLHFPYSVNDEAVLENGKNILLKEAYELDDAPNYEKFFFILSDKNIIVKEILNKAEALKKNPDNAKKTARDLFKNYTLKSLSLIKE